MKKPSLAWIDHSYHQKTKSSFFLRDLLEKSFDVTEYWDESWCGGSHVSAESINKHDYAFYLQVLSPEAILKDIKVPMLWAPMYDGEKFNYAQWKMISRRPVKVLSFSKKISAWAKRFSIPVFSVQYYYIPPSQERSPANGVRILFWYRGGIDFSYIRRMIDPSKIDGMTVIDSPDSGKSKLGMNDKDKETYRVDYINDGFMPRERYLELLNRCSVFIAPRKKEGIGAFTEALALGKCVVAYDDAVHNEYITNTVDGILFDESTGVLDLSCIDNMGKAAWKRAIKQNNVWLEDKESIASFMQETYVPNRTIVPVSFWNIAFKTIVFSRKIRYYLMRSFDIMKKP
jgi:glycosyltransferase involved in cell wall biosynthesis